MTFDTTNAIAVADALQGCVEEFAEDDTREDLDAEEWGQSVAPFDVWHALKQLREAVAEIEYQRAEIATMRSDAHLAREARADWRAARDQRDSALADASRLREQLRTEVQSSEQYARERDQLRTDRDDWKKECARLRGELEAVKSERNSLHVELKRVVDIAIDECGMPASAMLGADAPSRAMRKLVDERDRAVLTARDVDARLRIMERETADASRLRTENEAMRAVYDEALLWRRELIGERTSYDLRLEAAIDDATSPTAAKNGAGE